MTVKYIAFVLIFIVTILFLIYAHNSIHNNNDVTLVSFTIEWFGAQELSSEFLEYFE